jgi:hypothetical protein
LEDVGTNFGEAKIYLVAHPPARKWVITTPIISGLTLLIPFITVVITHLLSGMSHQVGLSWTYSCILRVGRVLSEISALSLGHLQIDDL